MNAIDYLRNEIRSYFPESSELQLSSTFALHRRFNFYFEITSGYPFLLYLNWDGEGDRFTLKCLEFNDSEVLSRLIRVYPEMGSKSFNIGKPRTTVSFIYDADNKLRPTEFKGLTNVNVDSNDMTGFTLMQCVDPAF